MSKVGYIRVSTIDQNTERQLKDIKLDKIFEDKCSGKNINRPALIQLKEYVRHGDEIYVHDISRMARNVNDLLNLVNEFKSNGVSIKFVKENLVFDNDESNPMNELMLTILGAIYSFERSMLLERQREGIAIAKAAGKYRGKQSVKPIDKIQQAITDGIACKDAMAEFEISKAYFYKIKKQMSIKSGQLNTDAKKTTADESSSAKPMLYVEVSPRPTPSLNKPKGKKIKGLKFVKDHNLPETYRVLFGSVLSELRWFNDQFFLDGEISTSKLLGVMNQYLPPKDQPDLPWPFNGNINECILNMLRDLQQ